MSQKKKKIPEEFKYNGFVFRRVYLSSQAINYIKSFRKVRKEAGYYTKLKTYDGKPILYVSKRKRDRGHIELE
jgi:hypothetical protein